MTNIVTKIWQAIACLRESVAEMLGNSGTVSTTNATPALITSVTVPTNETVLITSEVLGRSSAGASYMAITYVLAKNVSGTVTIVGATTPTVTKADSALSTAAVTPAVSGTAINYSVTGVAATNIKWSINTTVKSL